MSAPQLTVYANGPIAVTGDQLNTFMQTCDTAAQMRGLIGVIGQSIFARGIASANDGLGGFFYWNSTAAGPDDNLNTIVPAGAKLGAWVRVTTEAGAYLPLAGGTLTGPLVLANTTLSATLPGTFTNTQMNLGYSFETNGLTPLDGYQLSHSGHVATLGVVTTMAVPSGSTVYEADGFASYVTNASTTTGACAGSFYAYNVAAGTTSYGLNPLVSDQGHVSTVVGAEFDIGASNTGSTAYGINMIGVFPNGTPATAVAYQASVLNSPWQYLMVSYNGTSENFALVGALGTTASSNGQPIQFNVINSSGTVETSGIQAVFNGGGGANLILSTPTGEVEVSGEFSATGTTNFLNGFTVAIPATGALAAFFSGATPVGSISTNGTTTAYNTTSDRRLKNIGALSDGSLIDRLKVYIGSFKDDPTGTKRSMLIADEAQQEAPWSVTGMPGAVHESDVVTRGGKVIHRAGDIDPQMMDHTIFVPDLIAKCQSLQAQLSAAIDRIVALEGKGSPKP